MTVEELITALAQFGPDEPVVLCVDGECNSFVRKAYRYDGEIVLTNECDEDEDDDEGDDMGYCATCRHCSGVDEEKDVCVCGLHDPHADWRYNDNEPCPKWAR